MILVWGFIVYGKIANDDVGETVQAVLDGLMPFDFAMQKLVFMPSKINTVFVRKNPAVVLDSLNLG
jgi:hypothetical protein